MSSSISKRIDSIGKRLEAVEDRLYKMEQRLSYFQKLHDTPNTPKPIYTEDEEALIIVLAELKNPLDEELVTEFTSIARDLIERICACRITDSIREKLEAIAAPLDKRSRYSARDLLYITTEITIALALCIDQMPLASYEDIIDKLSRLVDIELEHMHMG